MSDPKMCGCGRNPATEQPHSCPYQSEINDDDSEWCDCCEDCTQECVWDI